ncbi:MAG: hypothetical protein JWN40_442 [Phycisphaerales bacterium]|nr:hypothetical protein [Phycisphaerales bacterium]
MTNPDFETYRLLPQETDPEEFWIVAILRMPSWIDEPPRPPFRPYAALILTKSLGIHLSKMAADRAEATAMVVPALVQFATGAKVRVRPARIATNDPTLERHLCDALGDLVAGVKTVADLPPLDAVKQQLARMPGSAGIPDALSVPGVTREDLRALARAAADFHRAAPWRHLNDHDLLRVDSPPSPAGQKYAVVMGAGGETFGLAFYASLERYKLTMEGTGDETEFLRAPEPLFSMIFSPAMAISFGDHDLWEDEKFPLATPEAYPFAAFFDAATDAVVRPNAALLNHTQAILAALALTTEQEMDAGRWRKTVPTLDGPVEYTLTIPALLKSQKKKTTKKAWPSPINNPRASQDRAEELFGQAIGARGRRQIQLARQVLELDPDNADALGILARRAGDPVRRLELYAQAVDAGRRAIGESFDLLLGHFWLAVSTRPYLRARVGLAMALRDLGRHAETLEHLLDMLRLNPNDNQGIRDLVPATLLALGRDRELLDFTTTYGRHSAIPAYATALANFRIEGNSAAARKSLSHAVALNRHVPHHLARGTRPVPESDFGYSPGQPSEAAFCIEEIGPAWRATPGALHWIAAATPPPATRTRRRR